MTSFSFILVLQNVQNSYFKGEIGTKAPFSCCGLKISISFLFQFFEEDVTMHSLTKFREISSVQHIQILKNVVKFPIEANVKSVI